MTAGGLFVFGYVFKYVTWVSVQSQVEETNRLTHEDASRQLTQARAEARDATEAQRQAADRLVEKDKEAARLTEQLQGFIL